MHQLTRKIEILEKESSVERFFTITPRLARENGIEIGRQNWN